MWSCCKAGKSFNRAKWRDDDQQPIEQADPMRKKVPKLYTDPDTIDFVLKIKLKRH